MLSPLDRPSASRPVAIAIVLAVVAIAAVAPARADGGGPSLDIATIEVGMKKSEVLARLGEPLGRSRVGDAMAWSYRDELTVYFGRRPWRHRVHVVGVRTRSPKDRIEYLNGLHVGDHVRKLVRAGGECFTAAIPDLGGRDRRGRYCQWPVYIDVDDEPLLDPRYPALVFRIMENHIAAIRSQYQPAHRESVAAPQHAAPARVNSRSR